MDNKDKPFQIAILLYPGVTALDAVEHQDLMKTINALLGHGWHTQR